MPWRTQTIMDERAQFAIEASKSIRSFAETCRRFGISRPTGHKWLKRYRADGIHGLADQSRRPRSCSHATAQPIVDRILELRRQFDLGARKIQRFLREEFDAVPCVDTIHNVLKRHGCVERRKPRRRQSHPGPPPTSMDHPNDVWSADFKGEFKTRNGRYCYPLTIQDGYSRYLLDCRALSRLDLEATTASFQHLFRTLGLPNRIRTDNGPPFATRAIGRLSQLSVGWIKLGIRPELIEPGKPYQNGRHERMHRTLGERTAMPPAADLRAQQKRFDRFRCFYNTVRPHQSLGQETPASVYRPPDRSLPARPQPLTYPAHFELRLVSQVGNIKWRKRVVYVSRLLSRELVALEPIADGVSSVYFGPIHLGCSMSETFASWTYVDYNSDSNDCKPCPSYDL